jgi:hypothetical protein
VRIRTTLPPMPDLPDCAHCGAISCAKYPRSLCRSCWQNPSIRAATHPELAKYGHRGIDATGRRPAPESHTEAMPGTDDKIAALAERFAAKQDLWHPDDARPTL